MEVTNRSGDGSTLTTEGRCLNVPKARKRVGKVAYAEICNYGMVMIGEGGRGRGVKFSAVLEDVGGIFYGGRQSRVS